MDRVAEALYKQRYGPRSLPFRGGVPTKRLIAQQRREILAGRSDYWPDPNTVFNPELNSVTTLAYDRRYKIDPPMRAKSARAMEAAQAAIARRYRPAQVSIPVSRGSDQYALRTALKARPQMLGRLNYRLIDSTGQVIAEGYANYDGSRTSYITEFDHALRANSDTMIWDNLGPEGGRLEVGKMLQVAPSADAQTFREGDINCLVKVILKRAQKDYANATSPRQIKRYRIIANRAEKLAEEFKGGVSEADLQRISDVTQARLRIYQPLLEQPSWEVVPQKGRHQTTYNYINTRLNHVDGADHNWGVAVTYTTPTSLTQTEMDNKIRHYRNTDTPFVMSEGALGPWSLRSNEGAFVVCDQEFQDLRDRWVKKNDLGGCWLDAVKYPEAAKFVLAGTHFNGTRDFKKVGEEFPSNHGHIDGYRMYKTAARAPVLGRITDFARTDKIHSIGLYRIANVNTSACSPALRHIMRTLRDFENKMVVTSPTIEFYRSLGVTCDITEGLWGLEASASMDDDDEEWDVKVQTGWNKTGGTSEPTYSRRYAKHFGMLAMHRTHIRTLLSGTTDYYGAILAHDTVGNLEILTDRAGEADYALALTPKTKQRLKAHITAFVTGECRIMLVRQLLKMDHTKLTRVDSDGISFEEHEFELLPTFRRKPKSSYANTPWRRMVSGDPMPDDDPCLPKDACGVFKMNILVKGPGGSGKSYDCGTNTTHINPLYVAHSRQLERAFKSQFPHIKTCVYNDLLHGKDAKALYDYASNIYADECTMLSGETKRVLRSRLKGKIYWIGDPECQLLAFNHFHHTEAEDKKNHDKLRARDPDALGLNDIGDDFYDHVIEKEHVFRFKDKRIRAVCGRMRELIKDKRFGEVFDLLLRCAPIVARKEMNYTRDDAILAATRARCAFWTDHFKDIEKYLVVRNGKEWSNGDIRYDKPAGCAAELRHGFTIHSFQGGTIRAPKRLFIDIKGMGTGEEQDARMIYIACSRVERLDQITLVRN
jgi:hypothetical protein